MSLLMDALKRAEEAKRRGEEPPPAELQPLDASTAATTTLPPLPDRLELLDKEFFGEPSPPPFKPATPASTPPPEVAPPSVAASGSPAAARALFEAKRSPTSSRAFLLLVSVGTLLALIGIGAYFWWQLQPPTQALMPQGNSARVAAAPPLPPTVQATVPALQAVTTSPSNSALARNDAIDIATRTSVVKPLRTPMPARTPRASRSDDADGIRFAASHARIDPALERAYDLLQNGDRRAAQTAYQTALRNDPASLDALHGLAAIAVLNRDNEAASSYYQKALDLDPRDPVARAGLGSLPQNDLNGQTSVGNESRLRSALAEQPASGPLNFALGNALSASGRWPEAQQAYFQAVTADADNPDYLFNLAISLDQLRKNALAGQYYQRALTAAAKRSHTFDLAKAADRLRALQP